MHAFETGCWCRCWCCELAVHVMETGCRCRVPVLGCARDGGRLLVPGAGAGAGAVSWLCRCRCWCCEPVVLAYVRYFFSDLFCFAHW